ncbi:hypothetical protein N431DRAFT_475452 [Stipitochalara longipes BDJ]|nr:hypothetical protein N431DRAFT_475452 [Stipitochalara longipes BDJ]
MDTTPLLNLWNNSNSLAALWIEPPYLYNNTPSISLALVGNTSTYDSEGIQSSQNPDGQLVVTPEIVTCSVYASWYRGDISIDFDTDTSTHSSVIDDDLQKMSLVGPDGASGLDIWGMYNQTEPGTREIQLDVGWANLALPPALTVGSIVSTIAGLQPETRVWAAGPAISLLVTDAMARFGALTEVILGVDVATQLDIHLVEIASGFLVQNISTLDTGNSTAFKVTRSQYGYSYSMMGLTKRLSAGVLLIHVLIALMHTAVAVWYK